MIINYRRFTFLSIIIFAYLVGGTINHIAPDLKIIYLSLLCAPLFVRFRREGAPLLVLSLILAIEFTLSAVINNIQLTSLLLYFRLIIMPVAIKILVDRSAIDINSEKFKLSLVIVGIIQLPVVVCQQMFYSFLSRYSLVPIAVDDYDFGTFGLQNDFSMSFYLTGLVFLLLYTTIFKYKKSTIVLLACWLTLTILYANSSVSYISVIALLLIYLIRQILIKRIATIYTTIAILCIAFFLSSSMFTDRLPYVYKQLDFTNTTNQIELFSTGELTKIGGVAYFFGEPVKLIGDGPQSYYNPISRQYILGVTGHALAFYAEVGVFGLFLSYAFCLLLLPKENRFNIESIIWLTCLLILSLSANILADVSIILTFCIVIKLLSISKKLSFGS